MGNSKDNDEAEVSEDVVKKKKKMSKSQAEFQRLLNLGLNPYEVVSPLEFHLKNINFDGPLNYMNLTDPF